MRITAFILITFLVITAPYYVYLPAILIGIVFFPFYLEAVLFGVMIDVVYGSPNAMLLGFPFAILASALVLFAVRLRGYLRFNA